MDMLQGKKLVTKDCQSHKAAHYLKKANIIIYYFSASWVADMDVLEKLKAIYVENENREMGMEVIYVSSDTEEKQFSKTFRERHGSWPAIAPQNVALAEELRYRYDITSLPRIIVVRKEDGFIISRRGREELEKSGINVLVTWTDYESDLIMIDDNLIDLATPAGIAEEPKQPEEQDNDDLQHSSGKV